ncbi:MAG: redoxin domain-containing protein [Geminicoccaceae bacterium]
MKDIAQRIYALEGRIIELEEELLELRNQLSGEAITDFSLVDWHGESVRLSALFGSKDKMLLIHNMGFECSYCTMWADGFNAVYDHVAAKAAFVISSPDTVDHQQRNATARGWRFPMVSTQGSTLAKDLGFERDGKPLPGVSALLKTPDGGLRRHGLASFGPGDRFCPVWNLLDLLPKA